MSRSFSVRAMIIAMLAAVFALPAPATAKGEQKLADFRRIIIAEDALAVQKAAAEELAAYAGRISGRKLEIISPSHYEAGAEGLSFFVGDQAADKVLGLKLAPWRTEEWLLRTVPGGLVLAGDDKAGNPWSVSTAAGSMLAVYTLLDDYLGVRWFWPGPFGEHVPSNPDALLPSLNIRSVPRFIIRSYSLGYSSYQTKDFKESARRWARRTRQAWVPSAVFGHSWSYAFHEKQGWDIKEHPEWFALVGGKRRPPQVCTTNPEVIDRMVEYVLSSKLDITNISPSDGGGFCQCSSCTALDVPGILSYDKKTVQLSDRIFTYANEVARRVREKNPQKSVGMFAYTFYNRPPVRISKLEPNLYLSFVYQAAGLRDPEAYREWRDTVAGWQKLGARMVVREGWGNHYYLDLPFIHYKQILANLSEAANLGFIAAYGEGSKSFATQAPNNWAIVRMMWDPSRDAGQVMDDFFKTAYGPAAADMRAFFDTYQNALDRNWARRRFVSPARVIAYANLINSWHIILPKEVLDEADRHLAKAAKKVPAGEYTERIAFHRFGQDYTRVMLELLDCYRLLNEGGLKMDYYAAETGKPTADPAARERLLKRAFELGERREEMLLAHRDWAAMDEGLYAYTNDARLRQWHTTVKSALKIDKPSALTKATLQ